MNHPGMSTIRMKKVQHAIERRWYAQVMGSASPLKDAQIRVNLDENTLERVRVISSRLGTTPTAMGRVLIERMVEAYEEHGDRLPWPPRFQFYEADPVSRFTPYKITDHHSKHKAAEEKH